MNVRNFKFFFVDNGSKDQSKKIIKSTAKKIRYKILNFKDNSHGLSCKFGYLSVIKLKKKSNIEVKGKKFLIKIYENLLDGSEHFALIKGKIKKISY